MKSVRNWIVTVVSIALVNAPFAAYAQAPAKMISTSSVVADLSRSQTEENIQKFLERSDIKNEMIKQGLTSEEATMRLASLSEIELQQLSGQIEQSRAGGDILVTVLIVVLIIFLVKRI